MKLIEKCICVDKKGSLVIPMELVEAAGLQSGAEVAVTLAISEEGLLPCPVIFVTADISVAIGFGPEFGGECKEEEEEPEDDFKIPHDLLQAAGIPVDSDLDVTCIPGVIVIKESDILNRLPDGLRDLFQSFGIHPETVRDVMKKEDYFA